MRLTRPGFAAVMIAAAFFAGSVVALATAGDGAQVAKKKKSKPGPPGPAGPAGPQGAQGPAGATNVAIRISPTATAVDGTISSPIRIDCLPGERAIGGGIRWQAVTVEGMRIAESFPVADVGATPIAWIATAENNSGTGNKDFNVRVVCASP